VREIVHRLVQAAARPVRRSAGVGFVVGLAARPWGVRPQGLVTDTAMVVMSAMRAHMRAVNTVIGSSAPVRLFLRTVCWQVRCYGRDVRMTSNYLGWWRP
jgi:hypothetical protein